MKLSNEKILNSRIISKRERLKLHVYVRVTDSIIKKGLAYNRIKTDCLIIIDNNLPSTCDLRYDTPHQLHHPFR